jgi:hypothetical protein
MGIRSGSGAAKTEELSSSRESAAQLDAVAAAFADEDDDEASILARTSWPAAQQPPTNEDAGGGDWLAAFASDNPLDDALSVEATPALQQQQPTLQPPHKAAAAAAPQAPPAATPFPAPKPEVKGEPGLVMGAALAATTSGVTTGGLGSVTSGPGPASPVLQQIQAAMQQGLSASELKAMIDQVYAGAGAGAAHLPTAASEPPCAPPPSGEPGPPLCGALPAIAPPPGSVLPPTPLQARMASRGSSSGNSSGSGSGLSHELLDAGDLDIRGGSGGVELAGGDRSVVSIMPSIAPPAVDAAVGGAMARQAALRAAASPSLQHPRASPPSASYTTAHQTPAAGASSGVSAARKKVAEMLARSRAAAAAARPGWGATGSGSAPGTDAVVNSGDGGEVVEGCSSSSGHDNGLAGVQASPGSAVHPPAADSAGGHSWTAAAQNVNRDGKCHDGARTPGIAYGPEPPPTPMMGSCGGGMLDVRPETLRALQRACVRA